MQDKKDVKAYFLIKIGEKEHMNQFLNEGIVYMNSVSFFRNCLNREQGDIFEGAEIVKDGKVISLRKNYTFEKIFCMWHLNNLDPIKNAKSIQEKDDEAEAIFDFRDYNGFSNDINNSCMVVIHNVLEFHNRLRSAFENNGYKGRYKSSHITYYDPFIKQEQRVDVFNKPLSYQNQNEIRYCVMDNNDKPLIIKLGDISDIAKLFPLKCMAKIKYKIDNYG